MMPCVAILAGGLGTRLHPKTIKTPKSLVEVAGKPFMHHQLSLLKSRGVSDVVLCLGNLGEHIESYVKDGSDWGLKVQYSYDGDALLGTGGAIKKATAKLPEAFFVLYGDSYLDVELEPILKRFELEGKQGLMTVYRNGNYGHRNNVLFRNGRIEQYNKENPTPEMEHIDYGVNMLTRKALEVFPSGAPFDLAKVYTHLIEKREMAAFEVTQRFYEVGSFQGISDMEEYLRSKEKR